MPPLIGNSSEPHLYLQGLDYACANLGSDETDIHDITLSKLFELIDRRETYWGSGTQGGSLQYVKSVAGRWEPHSPRLTISYHIDHGFMFFTYSRGASPEYQLALQPVAKRVQAVEFDIQSTFWFPSNAFFTVETAKQIVAVFVNSRGMDWYQGVQWVPYDIDLSVPNAWKTLVGRTA